MASRKHNAWKDAQPKSYTDLPPLQHIQVLQSYKDQIEKILTEIETLELLPHAGFTQLINVKLLSKVTNDLHATFIGLHFQQKDIYKQLKNNQQ